MAGKGFLYVSHFLFYTVDGSFDLWFTHLTDERPDFGLHVRYQFALGHRVHSLIDLSFVWCGFVILKVHSRPPICLGSQSHRWWDGWRSHQFRSWRCHHHHDVGVFNCSRFLRLHPDHLVYDFNRLHDNSVLLPLSGVAVFWWLGGILNEFTLFVLFLAVMDHIDNTLCILSLSELTNLPRFYSRNRLSLSIKFKRLSLVTIFVFEHVWGLTFRLRFCIISFVPMRGHILQGRVLLASMTLHCSSHRQLLIFNVVLVFSILEIFQLWLEWHRSRQGCLFLEPKSLIDTSGDSGYGFYLLLLDRKFCFFLPGRLRQFYQILGSLVD